MRRPYNHGAITPDWYDVARDVHLLADTGADNMILAPRDAATLRLGLRSFPRAAATGVGARTATAIAVAGLTLDTRTSRVALRTLDPQTPGRRAALYTIASLLGRDVLQHVALYVELRRNRVLLLEAHEADALSLA